MLEEYLDGPEVDVDLVLSEGEAVYGAITDNWPTVEPYFNETGSNCPSILPTKQQQELMQMAVQSTNCLGFKQVGFLSWCCATSFVFATLTAQQGKLLGASCLVKMRLVLTYTQQSPLTSLARLWQEMQM